ncbi:hypothetical protein D3C78_1352680 [compost metagenome]
MQLNDKDELLDAGQAKFYALREELAISKAGGQLLVQDRNDLQQRLADAERRNVELAGEDDQRRSDNIFYTRQLLDRAAKVMNVNAESISWFDVVGWMEEHHAAITKPEEAKS